MVVMPDRVINLDNAILYPDVEEIIFRGIRYSLEFFDALASAPPGTRFEVIERDGQLLRLHRID